MSRFALALLLAALAALAVSHAEPRPTAAQEKKKDKKATTPEPAGDIKDDLSRVLPVFDPGSHTQQITAMGFTKDKSRLVTVGQDYTVQVWSAATGERLDILRLPGYGREKGYDPNRWDVAAVSPDGTTVAVGGQAKWLFEQKGPASEPTRLVVLHLPTRKIKRVVFRGNEAPVTALAFSPSGESLAVGYGGYGKVDSGLVVLGQLPTRIARDHPEMLVEPAAVVSTKRLAPLQSFAFTPDGSRLAGGYGDRVGVWDVPAGISPVPTMSKEFTVEGDTHSLAWSPDGKQFARTADSGPNTALRTVELWGADGTRAKVWKSDDMTALFTGRPGKLYTVRFLDPRTLFVVANGPAEKKDGGASLAATLDIATGKDTRVIAVSDGVLKSPNGAVSADGGLVAVTVTGNTEVVIGPPVAGGARVRCGVRNQLPHHVGWSKDPAKPGFAWTYDRVPGRVATRPDILSFGFDLTAVEPLGAIKGADYVQSFEKLGDWTMEYFANKGSKDEPRGTQIKQAGKVVKTFPFGPGIGHTYIPNGDKAPRVAFAFHHENEGDSAAIHHVDGTRTTRLLPLATRIGDMAASPDGRFLICTTGTPRLVVYRPDGSSYPFCSFAQLNGEWVLWTPEGYYAASPGGEKMFGWAVNSGPNELVAFHPAEKFASQFRRPDVIKLAIEKGSVKEALVSLKTVAPDVERIVPPSARLKLLEQRGATVKVQATANSGAKDKPITSMRVLLDGRPLPGGIGVWPPKPGAATASATFDIDVPAGTHELKVLSRSGDGSAVSDPLPVRGPKSPGSQPTLHRLCVGINDYDEASLKLDSAAKDARAIYDALQTNCVGADNRFGAARGELILNKDATSARVLKALADVCKPAKPGDLVVIFFAGHGVKKGDAFYLVTREADPAKDLNGRSLSGDDLRKALKDVECPVLLILDACHSAKAVKSLRPATDDLTRTLTDDSVGVTVMAAAMSHETAGESAENGYFTAGLLKGLAAGQGVPFDPYERQLYVHHLYSVAFSEVRRATNGKQNPFLNMPWTVPPMPIREVTAGK